MSSAEIVKLKNSVTERDHASGAATAPVTLLEYGNFECIHCGQAFPVIRQVRKVLGDNLRFVFRHFPTVKTHPHSLRAAEGAEAAGAQGKFWEMHDAIFDNQKRWASGPSPATVFDSLARTTGVEMTRWRECVAKGVTKPLIQADHQRAQGAGVRSTPSILIGNELLAGAHPIEGIRRVLDSALAKARRQD